MTDDLELIDIEAWPQLRDLAWSRHDRRIPGAEALALYERGWHHVDAASLSPAESALIAALARRYGAGGEFRPVPPPWRGGDDASAAAAGGEPTLDEMLRAFDPKRHGGEEYPRDDGEVTPEQIERIRALVRERHGEATVVKSLFEQSELERVDLDAWPLLSGLARSRQRWIPGAEALSLYERNWRHVEESRPSAGERALIEALASRFGVNGKLNINQQDDDERDARPNLLHCSDEQLAATMARFEELERQMWPALAALGNEVDAEAVPTRSAAEWLLARSPEASAAVAGEPGKWIVEREGQAADDLWALVHGAVAIGRLWAVKASGVKRATFYGGRHALIVYVPGGDLEAARATRAVLRELGVLEPLRYIGPCGDELLLE